MISGMLVVLVMCSSMANAALTSDQRNEFITIHNRLRSQIQPAAGDMMAIFWDDSLASSAQSHADLCPTTHSPPTGDTGENIAWGWPQQTVAEAFAKWTAEAANYASDAGACKGGQQCGHYTQTITASTTLFGCGHNECKGSFGQNLVQTYVCQYRGPGNTAGSRPYHLGASCSMCPAGFKCQDQLCVSPNNTLPIFPAAPATPTASPINASSPTTQPSNNSSSPMNPTTNATQPSGQIAAPTANNTSIPSGNVPSPTSGNGLSPTSSTGPSTSSGNGPSTSSGNGPSSGNVPSSPKSDLGGPSAMPNVVIKAKTANGTLVEPIMGYEPINTWVRGKGVVAINGAPTSMVFRNPVATAILNRSASGLPPNKSDILPPLNADRSAPIVGQRTKNETYSRKQ